MRGLIVARLAWALALTSCARPLPRVEGPLLEVVLDEARPSERPVVPGPQLELLMRFDPKLPSYTPRRLRFLLAAPGRLVFRFYRIRDDGTPGDELGHIDRVYGPELVAGEGPREQRWVVEPLAGVRLAEGSFLIGISAPERGSDPRLWATSGDSGAVYERELDGTIGRVRRTPVVRVEVVPGGLR